jgi:hypothetical protein
MAKPIQRANGKWQMKIRRKGQKPLSETFQTQEDAQKWARSIEREMDIGAYVKRDDTKNITFAELAKRYEEEVLPSKKGIQQSKSVITILTEDLGNLSLS